MPPKAKEEMHMTCWRDNDPRGSLAELQELQRQRQLQTRPARIGDEVYVDKTDEGRYYFRKVTYRAAFGGNPIDNTELRFFPGTRVKFTQLPDEVKKKNGMFRTFL
jgi:hypothetical protein